MDVTRRNLSFLNGSSRTGRVNKKQKLNEWRVNTVLPGYVFESMDG